MSDYDSSNLDILYKVRSKIIKDLKSTVRTKTSKGPLAMPGALNHKELYLHDQGNGNYPLAFRDANLAVLLELLLVQQLEGKSPVYRGEISGWAETGPNRVEFYLKDKQIGLNVSIDNPLSADAVAEFLKKAEMDWLYSNIRQICHEKETEPDRLHQKVRREMKEKVSQALDEML